MRGDGRRRWWRRWWSWFWWWWYVEPALAEQGGQIVVPEAGAGEQGHGLLRPRTELFYAQAVTGSSFRRGAAPRGRTDAVSGGLAAGGDVGQGRALAVTVDGVAGRDAC